MIRLGSREVRPGEAKLAAPRAVALAVAAALVAGLTGCQPPAQAANAPARQTPSGQPVPRYVSLKFGEVNARAGPGDDYRLLWTYRARGLPLQVIAETAEWRRVCDPEGAVAWVHQRTLDNNRHTVLRAAPESLPIRRRPELKARPVAQLEGRALASLESCKAGWCRITAGRAKGWVPADAVWGVAEAQQCHPRIAPAR